MYKVTYREYCFIFENNNNVIHIRQIRPINADYLQLTI